MEYNPDVLIRLNRIEGQIKGIQKMVSAGRDCLEVVQQMKALQAAINSTNQQIIKQYLSFCLRSDDSSPQDPVVISRLINLIEF